MKRIQFKQTIARVHRGKFNYLIAYDHMAGRKNRYEVMILAEKDLVVIGRELGRQNR